MDAPILMDKSPASQPLSLVSLFPVCPIVVHHVHPRTDECVGPDTDIAKSRALVEFFEQSQADYRFVTMGR